MMQVPISPHKCEWCNAFWHSWERCAALIKGENKTNPWTSRPITEEDIEHYGLEGEK